MNKTLHAYLDYPVALGLIAMPFVLGLGVAFLAAPFVLGFVGIEATYYWALGATVLLVVVLDDTPEVTTAA